MVNREKYEKAKDVAKQWYTKYSLQKDKYDELVEKYDLLKDENASLRQACDELSHNHKMNKNMTKKQDELEQTILTLRREKATLEGRVEYLEESRNDLRELLKDMRIHRELMREK